MELTGWTRQLTMADGRAAAPSSIAAYSEFMPPPRLDCAADGPFEEADPWGWHVAEHEEASELQPGLEQVAHQVVGALAHLVRGMPAHGLSRSKLQDNPYWPLDLGQAASAGELGHDRLVVVMPLALSRTQDDKGRIRWTLFGGSEQGPARPFWRSFWESPDRERPGAWALDFLARLLAGAFGAPVCEANNLHGAGFRILPQGDLPAPLPAWNEGPQPSWVRGLLLDESVPLDGVRYLLTFRPFGLLPEAIRSAYRAGAVHLIPSPASLIPWGERHYLRLQEQLPLAMQIPLLNLVSRRAGAGGLRAPQSGWMHEPRPDQTEPGDRHGPLRNTYVRTHRWARSRRDESSDEPVSGREDKMAHVLFGTAEHEMGLYGKPMARNAQLWTDEAQLLLDGPHVDRAAIDHAAATLAQGGLFGYRFQFPAMRVGNHELYWHRPLVAHLSPGDDRVTVVRDAPLGALVAYRADLPDLSAPVELWPRLRRREPYVAAVELFHRHDDPRSHRLGRDCRKLLDARTTLGAPLPRSFARSLLSDPGPETLEAWLEALPAYAADAVRGRRLADDLRRALASEGATPAASLTFTRTARRVFEVSLWQTIAALSSGRFPNRNNADCAGDPATRAALTHHGRDLEALGDHLLDRHRRAIAAAGMDGRAIAGDLPFHWQTHFDMNWSDGWRASQGPEPGERDLLVMIPGRDRSRVVIMADHYDTAYMEDRYDHDGVRLAAPGADDNTSATAALLLAAPVLLELSREGRLGCDVWLVHLTGEEFPADCLGARHLAARLVAGDLRTRVPSLQSRDLSGVKVEGIFVLDMVAHENPRRRGVFQIAPGVGAGAMRLALEAYQAVETWNALAERWDRHPARKEGRPARVKRAGLPPIARHPRMIGEVRPHDDPHSTLYNTDAQIFSDAGIPAVLFMEDYDIDRHGYHDSQDTMANIDLPYGAALVAIAIETVARVAAGAPHAPAAGEESPGWS